MQKIILYYKFCPVADPEAIRLWQHALCQQLGLKGRILLSNHGINGTLAGDSKALKTYCKQTKQYTGFKGMEFKWSDGQLDNFPKLSVKIRDEIVTFGVADQIEVDANGIIGGGTRLKPKQLHELVAGRDDVVFFDGRNDYEAAVGKFKNAVVANVQHSRDFAAELQDSKYDDLKDKPVVTYCTGGIRCEVLSMLMKKQGFKEVYQLDGGIATYGKTYGDDGLWEGSLYVFDGRMGQEFSDHSKVIGSCAHCQQPTSNYENCDNKQCNKLLLVCSDCAAKTTCQECLLQRPAAV